MKKLLVILSVLLLLAGCTEKEPEKAYTLVSEDKLTVAMSTDFAPMEFIDLTKTGQEQFAGSDVELAKFIANYMGLELEVKCMDFDTCQTAVANGIVDISISGYSYTTSRAASYLLSNDYFSDGDDGQVALIAKANESVYTNLASLNNKEVEVAAQNGALQQEIVVEQLPNAQLKAIDDLNSAYDLLYLGTYDAVVVAKTVAETIVLSAPDKYAIVEEQFDDSKYTGYHVLININANALCEEVNKAIAAIGEGEYAKWQDDAQALFLSLGENAAEKIVSEQE